MPQPALAVAHSRNRESEWETFRRLLTHDDRNSFYVLATDAGGEWRETAVKHNGLLAVGFQPNASYYITHNGFTSRTRKTEALRQLNALFFDLDCHTSSDSDTRTIVECALQAVNSAVGKSILPEPTMIIDSGRGLQLFYVLDRSIPMQCKNSSNERGVQLFSSIQQQLANAIESVIAPIKGIALDRATLDHARVSRIPGTYNRKAHRMARLVAASETFHSLQTLRASLASFSPKTSAKPLPRRTTANASMLRYKPLMLRRLTKLIDLQAFRNFDCEGNRELMCFVFYNTAVQIYNRDEAAERLGQFNARFTRPLASKELAGVMSSIDSVVNLKGDQGYYLIGVVRLIEMLGLTEEEVQAVDFFETSKALKRKQAKQQTKAKREARNKAIIELKQTTKLTQKEIAEQVGCSLRTVASVLREHKMTKEVIEYSSVAKLANGSQARAVDATCNFLPYESMKCTGSAPLFSNLLLESRSVSLTETLPSRIPVKESPGLAKALTSSLVLHPLNLANHGLNLSNELEIGFSFGLFSVFQGILSCFQVPVQVFSSPLFRRFLPCFAFERLRYG